MAFRLRKSPEEAAELFTEHFCPTQAKHAKACNAVTMPSLLDADFTFEELTSSLKKIKRKSTPGPDGITNQMLQNMPEKRLQELLKLFNYIWTIAVVPEDWKT